MVFKHIYTKLENILGETHLGAKFKSFYKTLISRDFFVVVSLKNLKKKIKVSEIIKKNLHANKLAMG